MSDADLQIRQCLDEKKSFVLDAGAGSGKTYSLVLALQHLLATRAGELRRAGQQIACITYTNVAKDQVSGRTGRSQMIRVLTIHEFLWDQMRPHQRALKAAVIKVNDALPADSTRKKDVAALGEALGKVRVTYSDTGSNFLEGRLHHDDLLTVARTLFEDHPLLSKLVAAKHPYLFVDEYQDASIAVIDVLLRRILQANAGNAVLGLFGDKLQNIYHGGEHPGIGEIPAALSGALVPIVKKDNYRCSLAVIGVLNRIRTDIEQTPAGKNSDGSAVFIHLSKATENPMDAARALTIGPLGWVPAGADERELYLTHKLIAKKGGYDGLLDVFGKRGGFSKDKLQTGEEPRIAFFLERIEPLAHAWEDGRTSRTLSILRDTGHEFTGSEGKKAVKVALTTLLKLRQSGSVREVLNHVRNSRLFALPDDFDERLREGSKLAHISAADIDASEREAKEAAFFEGLFALPYHQIAAFAEFFNEHTPFGTKHGAKGAEFDTVFVVLDDKGARWNLYSFDKYLDGSDKAGNPERFRRTRNVFYMCCSRAKRNLAVVDLGARTAAKDHQVQELFRKENCHYL